ncbi:hypothetical protein GCM10011390_11000 [Aureimonas endophytica]|uniref:Helix-turn-helix domain-containing protein n=1 Tax=Aureimonas endophytica TaxID=2027858 RepID=A0A917E1V2_9HYPH|nr:hypothetical protein [Aureimonas endophytica]GGD94076.1 hypothetical protein GCM10011390_11000 [Aureimonas endophytica]
MPRRSNPTFLDDTRKMAFAAEYRDGTTLQDLGTRFRLTARGVRQLVDELGLPRRQSLRAGRRHLEIGEGEHALIVGAYRDGASIAALRDRFELPLSQLYEILRRHGVALRRRVPSTIDQIADEIQLQATELFRDERLTAERIADRLGLTVYQVRAILKRRLESRRATQLHGAAGEALKARLAELYRDPSLSIGAIAFTLDVSPSTVTRLVRQLRIPQRGKGSGRRLAMAKPADALADAARRLSPAEFNQSGRQDERNVA